LTSFENDAGMPFLLFDRVPPIHHVFRLWSVGESQIDLDFARWL
jgi:hypothetical protein